MTTELQTRQSQLETFRTTAQAITMADPNVAARRPLADIVRSTLSAAGSRSTHTQRAYTTGIGTFLQWLETERSDLVPPSWGPLAETTTEGRKTVWTFSDCPAAVLWLVDPGSLDNFVAYRLTAGDTTGTADNRLASVRTFLSVAYRDKVLSRDQGEGLGLKPYRSKRQRNEQPVGRRLSVQEVRQLRQTVDVETNKGIRDRAILDCMLFAGLRRSEVAGMMATNVVQDQGRYWLRLTGKGRKTRRVKIHDTLFQSLNAWLKVAGITFGEERTVFLSVNKGDNIQRTQISDNVVERIVGEYGYMAGIAQATGSAKLSPHDLRRTFARQSYDNGATLIQVQIALGHSDPKTTARYIGADQSDDDTAVDFVRY
jgi:site-specific recombinase XerD